MRRAFVANDGGGLRAARVAELVMLTGKRRRIDQLSDRVTIDQASMRI